MELKPIALFFAAFVVIVIGIVVIQFSASQAELIDRGNLSVAQNLTIDNGTATALSQTPDGDVTSVVYNDTYLSFDGVNDGVTLSSAFLLQNNQDNYSISVWVNTSDSSSIPYETFSRVSISQIVLIPGGNVSIRTQNDSNFISYINGSIINDSIWHHFVLTKNGGNFSLYTDGNREISEDIGNPKISPLTSFQLNDGATESVSLMDEARFYNRTLSQTEVLQIHNSGRQANSSLPTEGLILWLPLNENSGTDIHSLNATDFQ